ncbi:MAG: aminomethyl-transferring glycine dehydrogenase subunit GcvPA [Candidatus Cloacimonetes bacterium]|nr:aminomethyl-transferring glycine dehydrogenase subunit GcvPA [Candidatus Cloacimonadota bacterium]
MPFISNTDKQLSEMLQACGVEKFEDLISNIPSKFLSLGKCKMGASYSELEIIRRMGKLAGKNDVDFNSFLGAGLYDHFIPAAVDHIISRPEFLTAYTPYQAEVSQGTLQYIYEYQSLICELTGMEISNAGMYDAASATAEAIMMAVRKTKKNKAFVSETIHPNYLAVIKAYTEGEGIEIVTIPEKKGCTDVSELEKLIDDNTAGVVVQTPNFYGIIEDAFAIKKIVHSSKKALFITAVDPISLAVLNSPDEYNADIVIGEGQALGNNLNFGGPLFGFFATSNKLARVMPGRIVGATLDVDGKIAYVLTLQAREQHIRRAKATSNICSSDQLLSLAACVYLSLLGKEGLKEVATQSTTKAHYLAEEISKIAGFSLKYEQPFFKEFVIKTPVSAEFINKELLKKNIFAGVDLKTFGKDDNQLLIAVTEKKTKQDLDALISALKVVNNG